MVKNGAIGRINAKIFNDVVHKRKKPDMNKADKALSSAKVLRELLKNYQKITLLYV